MMTTISIISTKTLGWIFSSLLQILEVCIRGCEKSKMKNKSSNSEEKYQDPLFWGSGCSTVEERTLIAS